MEEEDFSGGPVAKTLSSRVQAGLGLIPGRGTRFHMRQLSVLLPQVKIPHAAMKIEDPECHN